MYTKIMLNNKNVAPEHRLLGEIEPIGSQLLAQPLVINGKTYIWSSADEETGIVLVEEIDFKEDPDGDIRNEEGLECPHCGFVDCDANELHEDDGETDCSRCESDIKYKRTVVKNVSGNVEDVIYYSSPVRKRETVEIKLSVGVLGGNYEGGICCGGRRNG